MKYEKAAKLSDDGVYRYLLTRDWDDGTMPSRLGFIMWNPSTADAYEDDATIRRVVGFAKREKFGGVIVANIYAFRSTDPEGLKLASDPIGPWNLDALAHVLDEASKVVVGWGASCSSTPARQRFMLLAREKRVTLYCLGKSKSGEPRHPLYLKSDAPLEQWPAADTAKPSPEGGK